MRLQSASSHSEYDSLRGHAHGECNIWAHLLRLTIAYEVFVCLNLYTCGIALEIFVSNEYNQLDDHKQQGSSSATIEHDLQQLCRVQRSIALYTCITIMPSIEIQPAQPHKHRCRATCTKPRWDLLNDQKEPLALDIEFQDFKPKGAAKWGHRIGRIAFVNTRGQTVYDTYVRYKFDQDVAVKCPSEVFGVTRADLQVANGAQPIAEVEKNLEKIMRGRTIVGHGMRLDVKALNETLWEEVVPVDTQHSYGQIALLKLANSALGLEIQGTIHDPTEDARATMSLYLRLYPYQGRKDFKEVLFKLDFDSFPALGGLLI